MLQTEYATLAATSREPSFLESALPKGMEFTESESLPPSCPRPLHPGVPQEVTTLLGQKAQNFCSLSSLLGGAATAAAKADGAGDETRNQQDHAHGHHDLRNVGFGRVELLSLSGGPGVNLPF